MRISSKYIKKQERDLRRTILAFDINDIRSQLVGGGSRPSHFQVMITNPFVPAADIKVPVMCKAASIPGFQIGKIEVPYLGRRIPIPGDRVWEDWNVTIINDEDHIVKDALEKWSNMMNAFRQNFAQAGANPNNYKSTGLITQYSKDKSELRTYQMNGIFPIYVAPMDMGWELSDTIGEYQVTFAYDELEVVGGKTGDAGGN